MGLKGFFSRAVACVRPTDEIIVGDFHDKYLLGPKLGRGAFAEVYVTKQFTDDSASNGRAVKICFSKTDKQKKAMLLEEELWLTVGYHRNCVRLYDVFHGESLSYLVMERCTCSLYHHLKHHPNLTEHTLAPILSQMLESLRHVHSAWVAHRDVKPDNFLISGEDCQTVKLCDFGLSGRLRIRGDYFSDTVGTPPFMCPEMLLQKGYDFKADVWSVGVVAYAFLFGRFPYMPKTRSSRLMKHAIAEGVPPSFMPVGRPTTSDSQFRSNSAIKFVRSLLAREPEQRPSADDALNMEYMASMADECPAQSIDLPSLEQMISSAKGVGLFEYQDVQKEVEIDVMLNDLQMARHQVPLFKKRHIEHSPFLKTARGKGSSAISSENMSMASTVCPSDAPSRDPSKTSMDSRLSSKLSVGSRLPSKTSVDGRLSSKTPFESRLSPKQSVERRRSSKQSVESGLMASTFRQQLASLPSSQV